MLVTFQDRMSGGQPQEAEVYPKDFIDPETEAWCAEHPELFGVGKGVITAKRMHVFREDSPAENLGAARDILAATKGEGTECTADMLLAEHPDLSDDSFIRLRACQLAFTLLCEELRARLPASTYWMWRQAKLYRQGPRVIAASRGITGYAAQAAIKEATAMAKALTTDNELLARLWKVAGMRRAVDEVEAEAEEKLGTPSRRAQMLASAKRPLAAARVAAEDFLRGLADLA